jgi:hypothetical protein
MPTFRRIRRSIAALLLVLYLPACHYWATPGDLTPQEYIAAKHPKQVRITLQDQTRLVLQRPWVPAGDSLAGFPARTGAAITIPTSAVRQFEARSPAPGKTVLLVAGVWAACSVVGAIALSASDGFW